MHQLWKSLSKGKNFIRSRILDNTPSLLSNQYGGYTQSCSREVLHFNHSFEARITLPEDGDCYPSYSKVLRKNYINMSRKGHFLILSFSILKSIMIKIYHLLIKKKFLLHELDSKLTIFRTKLLRDSRQETWLMPQEREILETLQSTKETNSISQKST